MNDCRENAQSHFSTARVSRFQFSIKTMLTAMLVLSILMGLVTSLPRTALEITAPLPTDRVSGRLAAVPYLSELCHCDSEDVAVRGVVVLSGRLCSESEVCVSLHIVRSGMITEGNAMSVFRSGSRLGIVPCDDKRLLIVLAECKSEQGHVCFVDISGSHAGAGNLKPVMHRMQAVYRHVYPTKLKRHQAYIAYVEGEQESIVTPGMSIESFAQENKYGEYLVVVVERDN